MTFSPHEPYQPKTPPLINAPAVITVSIAILVLVHLGRTMLTVDQDLWVRLMGGFVPVKLSHLFAGQLDDVWVMVSSITSLVTYNLLHGDWLHLAMNALWMLVFGTIVARRSGAMKFLIFSLICGVGGALFHLLFHSGSATPVIGASAAISGQMGAVMRFMFNEGLYGDFGSMADRAQHNPLLSLKETFQNKTVLLFVGIWLAINLISGIGAMGLEEGSSIAWLAHIGGFVTGLVIYDYFDKPKKPERPNLYVVH